MFRTIHRGDVAALALRLSLAAIFISIGMAKLHAGWGTVWDQNAVPLSVGLQAVVAWCEVLAGIGLLVGLLTRVSSLVLLVIMVGSIWWFNLHPEYVRNFSGRHQELFSAAPVLWEYSYAVAGMCLALMALGGGLFSIDYLLWHYLETHEAMPHDTTAVTTTQPHTWSFRRVLYIFRPHSHGGAV
jgi:putative oxidoreductase